MIFFKLIVTNLLRRRVRTLISIAGIAFTVATMLTVVTILQGAVAMGTYLLPFYDYWNRQHLVMTILKVGQPPRMFFVEFMVQFIDFSPCLLQGGFP